MMAFEVTRITKDGGALTKRITLGADGHLIRDGSECVMSGGRARRVRLGDIQHLADLIGGLGSSEAITLGALREGLPDEVKVTSKRRINGTRRRDLIARSQDYISFRPGAPAVTLIDYDSKGRPPEVRDRIAELGGFWPALVTVLPPLAGVARVVRLSTSAGLIRSDTGAAVAGSDGIHAYVLVKDGADSERFLKTLHARCILAGLGWMMVGAGGQLLERSIIDRVVGSPERLVFEGTPVLVPPLAQDEERRRPVATEGEALDTVIACPPLTILEQARLRELRTKEAHRLAPDTAKAREAFVDRQTRRVAKRTGMDLPVLAELSSGNARGSCCRTCCCRSTIRSSPGIPLLTCSPIPPASRVPPFPIRSKASNTAAARRASCGAPTARSGSTALLMAAPSMN
jgi:hypothetical protein